MEQLTLNIINKSKVEIMASSAYNFRIELLKEVGKDDLPTILKISNEFREIYSDKNLINEKNIYKYFNTKTLPFLARYNDKIIGFITGVPIEHFNNESWCRYDVNLGKKNTIYTYAFIITKKYRKSGGYAKTLKMIYLNWAKKQGYKYVSGHVAQGISKKFGSKTEIIKIFPEWYQTNIPFEYYRRSLL